MQRTLIKINEFDCENLLYHEWLLTNGLGGFACSSLSCTPMRKYHSLLTASLPAPYGRTVMLNFLQDSIKLEDPEREIYLSSLQLNGEELQPIPLAQFRMEWGLPIWRFEFEDIILERTMILINMQNTLHVRYKLISSKQSVLLKIAPYFHFRANEQSPDLLDDQYIVHAQGSEYEIERKEFPKLRLYNTQQQHSFTVETHLIKNVYYEIEEKRGLPSTGNLTSPGYYLMSLNPGDQASIIASTEDWKTIHVLSPQEARLAEKIRRKGLVRTAGHFANYPPVTKLVLAADQFIMTPRTRFEDVIRLQAAGEQVKSIIAGYPWFTDWGRDTMISLEGLTLTIGRYREAYAILRTFAYYVKDGLIPNMFPDGQHTGIYNTADATLWFFHAASRYIEITGDTDILDILLPKFQEIIRNHSLGTLYGIKVDKDGLLTQGQEGVQLTWMDAKVGNWVVTPRRGKAVEINALWYNALRLMEKWTNTRIDLAEQCFESFNKRFWYEHGNYLYDVVDGENGDDPSLRPNQLFAISLENPALDKIHWESVLKAVKNDLLTPFGLRTLSPYDKEYKPMYDGDLRDRDAAYHQGTVWPWLLGPFVDAWLKVYPNDLDTAESFLKGLTSHLQDNCIGSISEIFDAIEPYHARGCFAQAWSVAELLRCLKKVDRDKKIAENKGETL